MSFMTPFMGPIQIVITCLESFSLTWNPCICPKCGFINLYNWILLVTLWMCFWQHLVCKIECLLFY
jgi:hypothetical protein